MSKATETKLVNAITAEHSAEGAKQSSAAEMNAKVRETFLACAAHAAATNGFDGDGMLSLYYSKDDMPKGDTLKSRRMDWNTVIDAARVNLALVREAWPTADEAKELKIRNVTRSTFLKGCGAIKRGDASTIEEVREAMKAKTPDDSTGGDFLADIVAAGIGLMERDPATFVEFQDQLLAIQATFNAGRAAGKYRTAAELKPKGKPAPKMMAPVSATVN